MSEGYQSMRSFTTSAPMTKPIALGTKAFDPGVERLFVGFVLLVLAVKSFGIVCRADRVSTART